MAGYTLNINGTDYDLDWQGSAPPTQSQIEAIVRRHTNAPKADDGFQAYNPFDDPNAKFRPIAGEKPKPKPQTEPEGWRVDLLKDAPQGQSVLPQNSFEASAGKMAAPPKNKPWEAPLPEGYYERARITPGTLEHAMAEFDKEAVKRRFPGVTKAQMKKRLESYRQNMGREGFKALKEGGSLIDALTADMLAGGARTAETEMMRAQADVIGSGGEYLNKKVALASPTTWAAKGLKKFKPTENLGRGIEGATEAAIGVFNPLTVGSAAMGAASVFPSADVEPVVEGLKSGFTDLWDPNATPEQKGASIINWALALAPVALKGVPKIVEISKKLPSEAKFAESLDKMSEVLSASSDKGHQNAAVVMKRAAAKVKAEEIKALPARKAELKAQPERMKPIEDALPVQPKKEAPAKADAPASTKMRLPEDKPMLDRNIDWDGKTYTVKGDDQVLYDSLVAERNANVKDLEAKLSAAEDPAIRKDIKIQIESEFRTHKEKLDDFFAGQRQKQKVDAGTEPDLDAEFQRIMGEPKAPRVRGMDRVNAAKERIKARFESGELADANLGSGIGGFSYKFIKAHGANVFDMGQVGIGLVEAGVSKFGDWSQKMVEELGEKIKPHLEELFAYATDKRSRNHEELMRMAAEGQRLMSSGEAKTRTEWIAAMQKKYGGEFMKMKDAAWNNAVSRFENRPQKNANWLATGKAIPNSPSAKFARLVDTLGERRVIPGISRTAEKILLKSDVATKVARKALEKTEGRSYLEHPEDIEMAVNEMTRLEPKIADAVDKGISIEGKRRSVGLADIVDGMAKDGIDIEAWQQYRRAVREINLSSRPKSPITADRVLANAEHIDRYMASMTPEHKRILAKWDDAFDKYSDAMLDLYEHYGLRPKGWAAKTRIDNPNYFPMVEVATEQSAAMRQINPQKVASPDGQVLRAMGGKEYADGIATMAAKTEKVIRAGEANQAFLPFMEETAKNPVMSQWVEDVTDIVEDIEIAARAGKEPTAKDMSEHAIEMDSRSPRQPWEQQVADELRALKKTRKKVADWIDANGQDHPDGAALALDKLKKLDTEIQDKTVMQASSNANLDSGKSAADIVFDSLDQTLELPEGAVPTITLFKDGVRRVYKLDPFLWDAIRGSQPEAYSAVKAIFSLPAKIVRKLTTQNNPFFYMLKNPQQDITSASVNYGINPANIARGYMAASKEQASAMFRDVVRNNGLFGNAGARDFIGQIEWMFDPEKSAKIQAIGNEMAKAQGVETIDARSASQKLIYGLDNAGRNFRQSKAVKKTLDALDKGSAAMENGTRISVYDHVLRQELSKGTSKKLAERRAAYAAANTMNFGETGDLAKFLGRFVPYMAVPGETAMAQARAFRRAPLPWMTRAFTELTVPAIAQYMQYKDDPDYYNQPDYSRYGSIERKLGDRFVSVQVDSALGATFIGIPTLIMEALDGKRPGGISSSDKKRGTKAGAIKEGLALERKAFVRYPTPSLVAFFIQKGIYDNTGAVVDVRFQQIREYPGTQTDDKDYTYRVLQSDTLGGSLSRWGVRSLGYFMGKETEFPNPAEGFFPRAIQRKRKSKAESLD